MRVLRGEELAERTSNFFPRRGVRGTDYQHRNGSGANENFGKMRTHDPFTPLAGQRIVRAVCQQLCARTGGGVYAKKTARSKVFALNRLIVGSIPTRPTNK
jgi:hypothetical protein